MRIKTKIREVFSRVPKNLLIGVFAISALAGTGLGAYLWASNAVADSPMLEGATPSGGISYGTLMTHVYRVNDGSGGSPCWNGGSGCYSSHAMCLQPTYSSHVGDYGAVGTLSNADIVKVMLVTDPVYNSAIYSGFQTYLNTNAGWTTESLGLRLASPGTVSYTSSNAYSSSEAASFVVGHVLAGAVYTSTVSYVVNSDGSVTATGSFAGISDSTLTHDLSLTYAYIIAYFNSNYISAPGQYVVNTFTPSTAGNQVVGWLTGSYSPTPVTPTTGRLTVVKLANDESGNPTSTRLTGAIFWICADTSCVTTYQQGLVTGSDGTFTSAELEPGTYYLVEKSAPTGYVLNSTPRSFTIAADDTTVVYFYNDPEHVNMGGVRVKKVDAETSTAGVRGSATVQGTTFTIYNSNASGTVGGSTGVTMTADATGYASTSGTLTIADGGSWYCVKETGVGTGYNLSDTSCKPFQLTYDGQVYDLTSSPFSDTIIKGSLTITKQRSVYSADSHGMVTEPLAGVTFTLTNTADSSISYTTGATGTDGTVTLSGIIYGTYNVTENRSDANAAFDLENFTITINTEGQTVTRTVVNEMPDTPLIDTVARNTRSDPSDKTNPSAADKEIEISGSARVTDYITYSGLVAGANYRLVGELWKMSAPQLKITTKTQDFMASTGGAGSFDFDFDAFNSGEFIGETLSIIQRLYKKNGDEWLLIAEHNLDLTNTREQVTVANVGMTTTARSERSADNKVLAVGKVKIVDTVEVSGLTQGQSYVLRGVLKKPDGTVIALSNGATYKDETYTMSLSTGSLATVTVEFEVETSQYIGQSIIVAETLFTADDLTNPLFTHEDLTDNASNPQRVTVLTPTVTTRATNGASGEDEKIVNVGRTRITDEATYTGLVPGQQYRLTGKVVVAGSDPEITVATLSEDFAATTENGSRTLNFDFDSTAYYTEGRETKFVVYEYIYRLATGAPSDPIAQHEDPDSVDQTVTLATPAISTEAWATDGDGSASNVLLVGDTGAIDTVNYSGLIEGDWYMLEGELWDKDANASLEITAFTQFQAGSNGRGSVDVEFDNLDTTTLQGKTIAIKTVLKRDPEHNSGNNTVLVTHNASLNVEAEELTVDVATVTTTAADDADGNNVIEPEAGQVIRDRVTYEGLVPGQDYLLVARLVDKAASKAAGTVKVLTIDGEEVPAIVTKVTISNATRDEKTVKFTVDATEIPGKEIVVYERLYKYVDGASAANWEEKLTSLVASHEELESSNQTVKVRPRVGTEAVDSYDSDHAIGAGMAKIVDTVSLEGLSKEHYKIVGYVVEKKGTNGRETEDKPIKARTKTGVMKVNGRVLTDEEAAEFLEQMETMTDDEIAALELEVTTEYFMEKDVINRTEVDLRDTTGVTLTGVTMEFLFDTREFIGKELVIYEELYRIEDDGTETLIAWHKDPSEAKQTVTVSTPKIQTTAVDKIDEDKELANNASVVIADWVDYEGLVAGDTYTLVGELRDKNSGELIPLAGGETKVVYTFEATRDKGMETMDFEINTDGMSGREIVVFEELYYGELEEDELEDDEKLAEHKDLTSEKQTVWVKIVKPNTGLVTRELDGAKARGVYAALVGIAIVSVGALIGLRVTKKSRFGW